MLSRDTTVDAEVWRLLPWLAGNALDSEELERVLEHLKYSPTCRQELLFLSELRHAVEITAPGRPEPSEERFQHLVARIDRHEASLAGKSANGESRSRIAWLLAAQAVAIVVLISTLFWPGSEPPRQPPVPTQSRPEFQTLSGDTSQAVAIGPQLRLIFAEGVQEWDIRQLLLALPGEIVAGPTALGAYTVQLPRRRHSGQEPVPNLQAFRDDQRVAFAEWVRGP